MIRDVTDLQVYQRAIKLLDKVYQLANLLPRSERKTKEQLVKAAKSIAPNIAEGFAKKKSTKEFKRFLEIALGSSDEVITHVRQIKLIKKHFPNKISDTLCDFLIVEYKIESKQLTRLKQRWVKF